MSVIDNPKPKSSPEPHRPSRWAQRMNAIGRDILHALDPWRKLPWPKKVTVLAVAGTAVTVLGWVSGLIQLIIGLLF